jgi:hypothetical protein
VLFLIILIIGGSVSATSPILESIIVRNYSRQAVIITTEFFSDTTGTQHYWNQDLSGSIYDLTLTVSYAFWANGFILVPNAALDIIDYYPWSTASFSFDGPAWERSSRVWERFNQIPFIEKANNIFKSLRIATEDGNTVITLENLEEFVRRENTNYFIEIFDYDIF